ncbi:MAG: hypothetical protein AAF368_00915 [Planctomycetota bacterium]
MSEERMEELIQKYLSEEMTLGEASELYEGARNYRCSLSENARAGFDALAKEAEIRQFDFKEFTRGEIDLS